jgi:ParB/RepB/Spo0J family partition protein
MSKNTTIDEKIRLLLVTELIRSATNRKTFKQEALEEMASSIQEKGVIQPIVVRPVACIEDEARRKAAGKANFELVIGERRWRGSKIAGKTEIPAVIRELNDHEALKLQVIENAQREDPDPLEEAEQYDALLKSGKTTVDELCAEIGKSRATIYGRIKLLSLPEKVKEALRAGKITPQVALLIARIPNAKVAEEAAAQILKGNHNGEAFSFRQVQAFIAEHFMTQLKGAQFDPKDKTLVVAAGPCALCPKRTGNQKELFSDVSRADVCTDPVCFRQKCDAARARTLEAAKADGKIVLSPEESAELYPYNDGQLQYNAPVVELDQPCPFEMKKTWGEIINKLPAGERPQIIVAIDRRGGLHEVIGRKEAGEAARTLDLAKPTETRGELSPAAIQQRKAARDSREKHERTIRAVDLAITAVIEKQAKAKDTKALFRLLRLLVRKEANFDTERRVAKRHGFTTPKKDGEVRAFYDKLAKQAEETPVPFILETLLWKSSLFADRGLPEVMTAACKIYGIDTKKIEAAAKEKPAKDEEPTLPALKK